MHVCAVRGETRAEGDVRGGVPPAVLLGPVKALTYVFTHGLMAAALGYTWCHRFSWGPSVIIGALVHTTAFSEGR